MNKAIEVAAKWWADQLRGVAKQNTGDFLNDVFLNSYADKMKQNHTEEEIKGFEQAIKDFLAEQFEAGAEWGVTLSTDYDPDIELATCIKRCGIKLNMLELPTKTRMQVFPNRVMLAAGYGAKSVNLMETDGS